MITMPKIAELRRSATNFGSFRICKFMPRTGPPVRQANSSDISDALIYIH
jgi:hypothetical protein